LLNRFCVSYVPGGGDFYRSARLSLLPKPKLQLRWVLVLGRSYMMSANLILINFTVVVAYGIVMT
jgi:hypothetical protein